MKKVNNYLLWTIVGLFALVFNSVVDAQDDLYYNPVTDAPASAPATYTEEYDENIKVTRRYDDDDEYYEDDDYAYEYSSRIRRFHRHSVVIDYYDPFYIELYNYDPFYSPGTTIYVYNYNDYWSYRRWKRWHRWNSWNSYDYGYGGGWNTWGWNSCYSYNSPWYNPWVVNNYYYDPYWTWNGYNPYYHDHYYGNGWANNHYYYNNNNNGNGGGYVSQTYTGPRRGGSHVNPGYARIPDSKGRLATTQTNVPMVEKTVSRPGRTASDIEGNKAVGQGRVANDGKALPNTSGRRPEAVSSEPTVRTHDTTPTGRGIETPSTRKEEGYTPRRSEEVKTPRTEMPTTRRNDNNDTYTPRRTETAPASRTEESRPSRRTEERPYERPSKSSNNYGSGGNVQQSRPSRSPDSGSSTRPNSGSNRSSGDSGSSRSSSGDNSTKSTKSSNGSSGRGGRN